MKVILSLLIVFIMLLMSADRSWSYGTTGSESGMHTHAHPHRAAYVVQGDKLELVPGDGRQPSQVVEVADGEASFLPAATHNVRNIGATEIIIIETEIE